MRRSELPKPLGPYREWRLAISNSGDIQYSLCDPLGVVAFLLWRPDRGWLLQHLKNLEGLSLGDSDDPPFQEAEALYDAAQ